MFSGTEILGRLELGIPELYAMFASSPSANGSATLGKFSLDAEHALLKIFEEPKKNTHFFLIVPDKNALLPTLVSRFYFIPLHK